LNVNAIAAAAPAGARGGTAPGRLFLPDLLKAVACVLIVWHHLAFYGPMSDVAQPLAPRLMSWLFDHARIAVQVFLVVSGYLTASQLAPTGEAASLSPWPLILRRYRRLVTPLLAALVLALVAAAAVRPWLAHSSVPGVPTWPQLLVHGLLLQDVLGIEALSAGVWYVAIDLQLYILAVLLLTLSGRAGQRLPPARRSHLAAGLVTLLALLSLLWWNRQPALDATGLYFWGAYGLGMLAFWASRSPRPVAGVLALAIVGGAALALDYRTRIAVALVTALLLAAGLAGRATGTAAAQPQPAWRSSVVGLARISYSVFVVHFSVCLVTNAVVNRYWPAQPVVNALGMGAAFLLSLLAGHLLHAGVERHPATWARVLAWQAAFLVTGAALAGLAAVA
jgi:peptidoglycan/LPS O-acetylase OafA/YrhL